MNLFEFDAVSVAFDGRPVLEEFRLVIDEGDKVVFRGPSGSGKSTLLRLLLGFARPDSGEVRFRGKRLTPEVAWPLRREVAYVNQSPGFDVGSVRGFFEELFHLRASPEMPDRNSLADALRSVDLEAGLLDQQIGDLSGGERQRIALAATLLMQRSIFLLDEPTAALDGGLKRKVADRFLNEPGWTVIASAHDDAWFEDRENVTLIELKK